jgi:archaetidylinositol phosphate synthase
MLTRLKNKVQEWIFMEAKLMHKAGFRPNTISALGVILGALSGVLYWAAGLSPIYMNRILLLALITLLSSGFCDALDGALARLYGQTTALGGFLDSMLDRYVDAAVICGLILGGLCDQLWGLLALVGSLLTSYARARSEAADILMETVGIVERAERILIVAIASIINIVQADLPALRISVIILAIASNFTVFQRVLYFYRKVSLKK